MAKYIPVIPGNIKGADDARTDILTLLGISVDPMTAPEVNDGRMHEPVAAFEIDGKLYDLKSVLTEFVKSVLPISITEPADGDILVYDGDAKVWKNTATEEATT